MEGAAATPPGNAEAADRLKAKLDEGYPEAWLTDEPGTMIVGVFKRLERAETARGPRHIVILESTRSPGLERAVWLHHTVLRSQFRKAAPQAGELVAVRYEGKKTSGTGQEYDDWTVRVDRPEPSSADWSEVSMDDAAGGGQQPAGNQHDSPLPDREQPPPAKSSPVPGPDDDIPF